MQTTHDFHPLPHVISEGAICRGCKKYAFLIILQNLQENTSAESLFNKVTDNHPAPLSKKETPRQRLLGILIHGIQRRKNKT